MRILVDATPLFPLRPAIGPTGVGRWTTGALGALARLEPGWQIDFVIASYSASIQDVTWMGPNVGFHKIRFPSRAYRGLRHLRLLPPIEWMVGPADVVLGTNYIPLRARRAAEVPVVYDLSFIHHPETVSRRRLYFLRLILPAVVHRSPVVVTISHAIRSEIAAHYRIPLERIEVVTPGCDLQRFDGDPMPDEEIPGLPQRFFLYVGTLEPRKNLPGLLRAYTLLKARQPNAPSLVLAGGAGWRVRDLMRDLRAPSAAKDLLVLGYVDDRLIPAIYARAHALVFPSFYEGFGLPVIEAMASGCPVVASDRGAVREVAGDAALLIDPADPESIAAAMERTLDDQQLVDDLTTKGRTRASQFTWDRTGRELREVLVRATRPP